MDYHQSTLITYTIASEALREYTAMLKEKGA